MPANSFSILKTSLLDLLHELEGKDVPIILGGGYGLYLKQLYLQESNLNTLIDGTLWPRPRATQDLDILVKTEVIANTGRLSSIRIALDKLGYMPVRGAEYMQFMKQLGNNRLVKIDFLTGPLDSFEDDPRMRVDGRRVRPRDSVKLHAHRTDEAIAFQEETLELTIKGVLSKGDPYVGAVYIPQPFTYLLMKLFAFRDRKSDPEKGFARHHALDLYRIVAMLTREEYDQVLRLVQNYGENHAVVVAKQIIKQDFKSTESLGALRLREHDLFILGMDLQQFLATLSDLFRQAG